MVARYSLCAVFCISLLLFAVHTAAAADSSTAKANQNIVRQATKLGLTAKQVRDLTAAIKKDSSMGEAVKQAMDQGLTGQDLADAVQNEIKKRQSMMNQGQGMGQGQGHGMGQGQGMQQGQGMGMNGSAMGRGMMGQGQGMQQAQGMGQGMGMNGSAMGRGMMGGRGMGMGRGMRSGQ